MALIQSAASGNWNSGATWAGGAPPTAADTWQINSGHTVTVAAELTANPQAGTIASGGTLLIAFQMSTSQFADITVAAGGTLQASRSVSSVLRMAGRILVYGTLDYGTAVSPIPSNVGAAIVFVCTTDSQGFRSIVQYANNCLSFYGATRVARETTLAAPAAVGDGTITLAADIGLRAGTLEQARRGEADLIVIDHPTVRTANGAQNDTIDIYLVAGYNPVTKVVTLGDAGPGATGWARGGTGPNYNTIDAARDVGTRVILITHNVVVRGSAYNQRPAFLVTGNYVLQPCNVTLMWGYSTLDVSAAGTLTSCDIVNSYATGIVKYCTFADAALIGVQAVGNNTILSTFTASIAVGCAGILQGRSVWSDSHFLSCSLSYVTNVGGDVLTNCRFYNCTMEYSFLGAVFVGCVFSGCTMSRVAYATRCISTSFDNCTYAMYGAYRCEFVGCTIAATVPTAFGWLSDSVLLNTSVLSATECAAMTPTVAALAYGASFDHDGVAGAFRAWATRGTVNSTAAVVHPGRTMSYQHACASATWPVFMQLDYEVMPGETLAVDVYARRDAAMSEYLPRVQLVNPFADPLIDATNVPLAEDIMTVGADTWETLTVEYTNSGALPMAVRLRTLAKAASGNAYFDPIVRSGGGSGPVIGSRIVRGGGPW